MCCSRATIRSGVDLEQAADVPAFQLLLRAASLLGCCQGMEFYIIV